MMVPSMVPASEDGFTGIVLLFAAILAFQHGQRRRPFMIYSPRPNVYMYQCPLQYCCTFINMASNSESQSGRDDENGRDAGDGAGGREQHGPTEETMPNGIYTFV